MYGCLSGMMVEMFLADSLLMEAGTPIWNANEMSSKCYHMTALFIC